VGRIFGWLYQTQPPTRSAGRPSYGGVYRSGLAETPVIVFSICIGLILGFAGWASLMGAIRLVYSLHMQCLVNSLTHLNHVEEGDSSMNVFGGSVRSS